MGGSPIFTFYQYLNYLLRAKGAHALHSPFVFDLYTNIIKSSASFRIPDIELARKSLKKNHDMIDVIDFKSNTSHRKTISSIASSSLSSPKFSAFLHLLIKSLQAKTVLETGTSFGINTLYLSEAVTNKVITLDASPIISELAKKNFEKFPSNQIQQEFGEVNKIFETILVRYQPDFIFLDADHRGTTISKQIETILNHIPAVRCIVIHDIYWSKDMNRTWLEIVNDSRFNLSIDIFQAGLLFPSKGIEKQHFTLRF